MDMGMDTTMDLNTCRNVNVTLIAHVTLNTCRRVELVLSELQRLLPACLPPQVHRFHALEQRMLQCGQALLAKHAQPTSEMVSNLIAIELAYLNTSHPDFVGGSQAIALISQQLADRQLSDQRGGAGAHHLECLLLFPPTVALRDVPPISPRSLRDLPAISPRASRCLTCSLTLSVSQ